MRLIDADALAEQLNIRKTCAECEHSDGVFRNKHDDFVDACEAIFEAPTINTEPHWIPVEQALPEEETDVLVTVHFLGLKQTHRNGWNDHIKESYYVEVASHINGEWSSASDEYKISKDRHKVIAWMPLPEAFKGVTE